MQAFLLSGFQTLLVYLDIFAYDNIGILLLGLNSIILLL
jgi:hypothetical protein